VTGIRLPSPLTTPIASADRTGCGCESDGRGHVQRAGVLGGEVLQPLDDGVAQGDILIPPRPTGSPLATGGAAGIVQVCFIT
jgi:hypothetical protein